MERMTKIITLRLTDSVWSDLRTLAADEESSMSDIIRDVLIERLNEAQEQAI